MSRNMCYPCLRAIHTEGDSLGAKRQAGGRAGRKVSSQPSRPQHGLCSPPRASFARAVPLREQA